MNICKAGGFPTLLAVLILLIYTIPASAQEYSYARYDVDKGLVGSVVYDGKEDKDGFLWFATETGVSRFDGTHFRNFTTEDGLPDNEILRLLVDSRNRVWMLPFNKSLCYYQNGKIYNPTNDSLLHRLEAEGQILDFKEDLHGNMMLRGNQAYYFLDQKGYYKKVDKVNNYTFTSGSCGFDKNGHFVALAMLHITSVSVIKTVTFNVKGEVVSEKDYVYRPVSNPATYYTSHYNLFLNKDSILIERNNAIHCYSKPESFNGFSIINDTLCTINTGDGAILFNTRTNQPVRLILQGKTINNVLVDSEGNWWFMTGGAGIFRIGSFEFTNYVFSGTGNDALPIFSLYKHKNILYAGSDKGALFMIDPATGKTGSRQIPTSLKSKITAISGFTSGSISLGTDEDIFNITGAGVVKKINANVSIKSLRNLNDEIIASMHEGILTYREGMQPFNYFLGHRSTCSYLLDTTMYNGSTDGLYVVNFPGKKTWLGEKHPLLRNRITGLEGSPDGTLWIGTHGEGVIGYKDGKIICNLRQKDGLTSNICRNLFIAGNDLWVGTDKGLNRVRYDNGNCNITTYTRSDGLIADIINAIYIEGSTVYAGTPAGVTTFDADKISGNSFCKLRITSISTGGAALPIDTIGFQLPPSGNGIRFDFVGISYRSAGDVTYRYRLTGLNDAWQTTRETFLNYLSLPSGDYELQVIATNKYGVESDMIRVAFNVRQFLWEKTWFRILAVIFAWVLIWIFVHHRIKRIRKQNDERMQLTNRINDMEQMALKAQMNPHFIFNSLNSVQQYVIDKDILGANKFITEFSRLIRLTLDISSRARISIAEETNYLATYLELEKTKFEDKFTYTVKTTAEVDTDLLFIPPMILQPYVENSIRHGVRNRLDRKGHITVSFKTDESYLICCVEDNGVGRQKASQYKSEMAIEYQSKGMTLTARRIEMLNRNHSSKVLIDIEDLETNNIPAGTRVTVKFPLEECGRS
ncbi:sensor histidine kinase [Paraflavitalea sp. CAU 1676]|uniref:sensor histidine kinase n=1 Tax=Paraflavitalea sp. CAU 1676 TaxID=3032598 RepID=UPI0023DAAB31|nr:sensor histidine kinase [Paraflavitalea sp. CAU 1676]MDF2188759.1 histidine kinase [Paraflavitalea sp. CAU 1676]